MTHPLLPRYEAFALYYTEMTKHSGNTGDRKHWDVLLSCWCNRYGFDYEETILAFGDIEREFDLGMPKQTKSG